jgi:hypothetical protein
MISSTTKNRGGIQTKVSSFYSYPFSNFKNTKVPKSFLDEKKNGLANKTKL